MTINTPPLFLQTEAHDAESFRRGLGLLTNGRGGLLRPTDFAVSQKAGGTNMSVDVAGGQVAIIGTEATYQGTYLVENRGVANLAISAAHPTNGRRDFVVLRIRDSVYSGSDDQVTLEVVTGTPSGSPADPALPSGTVMVLARIVVGAAVSTITNANITDLRQSYSASQNGLLTSPGGVIVCTSTTRPSPAHEGMVIFETNTDMHLTYDGSAWVVTAALGAWLSWTPDLFQSVGITKNIPYSRISRIGRTVHFQCYLQAQSNGTAGHPIRVQLPYNAVTTSLPIGQMWWYAQGGPGGARNLTWVAYAGSVGFVHGLYNGTLSPAVDAGHSGTSYADRILTGDAVLVAVTYEAAS